MGQGATQDNERQRDSQRLRIQMVHLKKGLKGAQKEGIKRKNSGEFDRISISSYRKSEEGSSWKTLNASKTFSILENHHGTQRSKEEEAISCPD